MLTFIRRIKLIYQIYNFFHPKQLKHNLLAYKRYGIKKSYYSSISSRDVQQLPEDDHSVFSSKKIEDTQLFKEADEPTRLHMLDYHLHGYLILKKFVSDEMINQINTAITQGLANGQLAYENKNKIMFAFHKIHQLKEIALDVKLAELIDALLQGESILFQSINFTSGSEQHTHSDSFHMTTYPLGGLIGVWMALEDIDDDNGPLHYYPGSHLLPYYMNKDYDNEGNFFLLGAKDYDEYEHFIAEKIIEKGIEKKVFRAKKEMC